MCIEDQSSFVQDSIEHMWHVEGVVSSSNQFFTSRLVWFVAISGFLAFTIPEIADKLNPSSLTIVDICFLSLPWVYVAILCILAHGIMSVTDSSIRDFYIKKYKLLDNLRIDSLIGLDIQTYIKIRDNNVPELRQLQELATIADKAAQFLFYLALLWMAAAICITACKLLIISI